MRNRPQLGRELAYFEKVKARVRNKDAYSDFLKCLGMYSQDIISRQELLQLVNDIIGRFPDLIVSLVPSVAGDGRLPHGWLGGRSSSSGSSSWRPQRACACMWLERVMAAWAYALASVQACTIRGRGRGGGVPGVLKRQARRALGKWEGGVLGGATSPGHRTNNACAGGPAPRSAATPPHLLGEQAAHPN